MPRAVASLLGCLLLVQALLVVMVVPAPATAAPGDATIALGEHVVWEDGSRNLTGKISVFGTLTVRDYRLWFDLRSDGEASFWVMETGVLEFDNVTLKPSNSTTSQYFFIKVEGRFVAEGSTIEHLTGEFVSGGGIKCVNGRVELYDTRVSDCEVQGVYVEGSSGSAVLDNVTMENLQYGVHVKDGGSVTVRNGCSFDMFTRTGVLVNVGSADVSNSTFFADPTNETRGIAVRGGVLVSVTNCVIHECSHEGITLDEETSAGLYSVEVYNCTVGIKMSGSSAVIKDCHLHDCVDGLNLYRSDPKVRQCTLIDNYNGVASKDCIPGYELEGCTIGGNRQYGVYAIGKGLSETGTTWTDAQGDANTIARVIQWWLLDVNVSDHNGIPVIGADVEVRFANGTLVYNWTTDSLGTVKDVELEGFRVLPDGTNVTMEPYNVHIEKGDQEVKRPITMDMSKVLIVALGEKGDEPASPLRWVIILFIIIIIGGAIGYWWYRVR